MVVGGRGGEGLWGILFSCCWYVHPSACSSICYALVFVQGHLVSTAYWQFFVSSCFLKYLEWQTALTLIKLLLQQSDLGLHFF